MSSGDVSEHAISAAISHTRAEVYALHAALVENNLVAWTSGNVSARVPGTDLMVIKPSGVAYADLTPGQHGALRPGRPAGGGRLQPVQ